MLTVNQRRLAALVGAACLLIATFLAWHANENLAAYHAVKANPHSLAYHTLFSRSVSLLLATLFCAFVGLVFLFIALRRPQRDVGLGVVIEETPQP